MTSVRKRLREALGSGAFRRFLAVRATSQIGDGLFQWAAAGVLIFERPSENPALDLLRVTAMLAVPYSLIAPFTGVVIDRIERRKILRWTPVVRAVVALGIALNIDRGNEFVFLLFVLIVVSLNRFFLTTLAAVLPQLVPKQTLVVSNTASQTSGAVSNVAGQAVGTLLAERVGGRAAAAVAIGAFLSSGRIAQRLEVHRGLDIERAPLRHEIARVIREMLDGFKTVQQAPRVRRGLLAIGLLQFLIGVLVAVLFFVLIAELRLGPGSAFSMLAVLAVGVGAGVLIVPWVTERIRLSGTIRLAFLIGALSTMLPLGSLNRGLMSLSAGVLGIAYALVKIPVDTIVQQDIEDEVRGRAFSLYDMLFNGSRIIGTALSAIVYEFGGGTRTQLTLATVAFFAVAVGLRVPARPAYSQPADRPIVRPEPAATRAQAPPVRTPVPATTSTATTAFASLRGTPPDLPIPGPPVGSLVRVAANPGSRAEDEPAALTLEGAQVPIRLLWRGKTAGTHGERRILAVATQTYAVRLVADPTSGAWEVTATWRP